MDFEEAALRARAEDCGEMLVLEARTGDAAEGQGKAEGDSRRRLSLDRRVHVAPSAVVVIC
jgi:hypothetical protein